MEKAIIFILQAVLFITAMIKCCEEDGWYNKAFTVIITGCLCTYIAHM